MRAEKDQVYKAKGLKLDRDVAIKVLREDYVSDPERLRRFEQEARTASALNLPNTIYIYDIDKHGSTPYIAMEYVDGKTLRKILDLCLEKFSQELAESRHLPVRPPP